MQQTIASRKIAATICESWNDFDITNNAALILNGDSANLPIPDESVDFVVTDPSRILTSFIIAN